MCLSWRQSKRRSSSSFPSPFSILERKEPKGCVRESRLSWQWPRTRKCGPPHPENGLQSSFALLPTRPSLQPCELDVVISTLQMQNRRLWEVA